jgi:hypothetical protein
VSLHRARGREREGGAAMRTSAVYADLPAKTVAELSALAARIKKSLKRNFIEVARELIAAKALLSHGQFIKWVSAETGLSARVAQLTMAAFKLVEKNENFSHLPKSALYLLSGGDVPTAAIAAIKRRLDDKEVVPSRTDIQRIINAAKTARPNPVNLALEIRHESKPATVIDLKTIKRAKAHEAIAKAREAIEGSVAEFKQDIAIADIAVMLIGVLTDVQAYTLIKLLRKVEGSLEELASALEGAQSKCVAKSSQQPKSDEHNRERNR